MQLLSLLSLRCLPLAACARRCALVIGLAVSGAHGLDVERGALGPARRQHGHAVERRRARRRPWTSSSSLRSWSRRAVISRSRVPELVVLGDHVVPARRAATRIARLVLGIHVEQRTVRGVAAVDLGRRRSRPPVSAGRGHARTVALVAHQLPVGLGVGVPVDLVHGEAEAAVEHAQPAVLQAWVTPICQTHWARMCTGTSAQPYSCVCLDLVHAEGIAQISVAPSCSGVSITKPSTVQRAQSRRRCWHHVCSPAIHRCGCCSWNSWAIAGSEQLPDAHPLRRRPLGHQSALVGPQRPRRAVRARHADERSGVTMPPMPSRRQASQSSRSVTGRTLPR